MNNEVDFSKPLYFFIIINSFKPLPVGEQERLHAESLASAAEKRAREEAQASAKAIADAESAAVAKTEAEEYLRRLQQEHGEKVMKDVTILVHSLPRVTYKYNLFSMVHRRHFPARFDVSSSLLLTVA